MTKPKPTREIEPDLIDRLRARFGGFPLIKDWNLVIQSVAPGKALMTMVPNAHTVNSTGVVNGGVLASLADMACAMALSTHFDGNMPFATSDLHIRYLEPALGELAIEANVVRASARSAVLECRISCGEAIIAAATAQFIVKSRPRDHA